MPLWRRCRLLEAFERTMVGARPRIVAGREA